LLAAGARDAWQREYLDVGGRLAVDPQATHVRALAFGLVPDHLRGTVADRLTALVVKPTTPGQGLPQHGPAALAAPPFHIAHDDADRFVPGAQSCQLAEALRRAGITVEFTEVPGADHLRMNAAAPAAIFDAAVDFARRVTAR
jgi:acetyl esterase/lipase